MVLGCLIVLPDLNQNELSRFLSPSYKDNPVMSVSSDFFETHLNLQEENRLNDLKPLYGSKVKIVH